MSYDGQGLYFEEFEVGQEFFSPARTVTETDVVQFAALSGDYNALHTDAEFAKGTLFGERVAHGLLGLSIASGLAARIGIIEGTAEAFMGLTWKFKAPIRFGDTIRLAARVIKTRSTRVLSGGIVTLELRVINQADTVVQQGDWTLLIKAKPAT